MKTAKYYNIQVTGKSITCDNCALEKMKRENINKLNENRSDLPVYRFYCDIIRSIVKSYGGYNFFLLLVDECTRMKWSYFIKEK